MLAACTIVSRNYLHFARTLCQSFLAAHPGAAFYVLLVDRPGAGEDLRGEPFTAVWVEELGIPDFLSVAFQYGISSPLMRPFVSGNVVASSLIADTNSPVAPASSAPSRRRPSAE